MKKLLCLLLLSGCSQIPGNPKLARDCVQTDLWGLSNNAGRMIPIYDCTEFHKRNPTAD